MSDHGITPTSIAGGGRTVDVSQDQIDRVVATVRRLCGWHVWPVRDESVTVDTPGDPVVFLPTKHLVDVTAVEVDGVPVDIGDVSWSQDGMVELRRVPRGFRKVTVTCQHGYESAPDLEAVCVSMVRREALPQQQYQVGSISVGAQGGVTPQSSEWRIVDMHKMGPLP